MDAKKSIALCASISFYREVVQIKNQLAQMGFVVRIPELARIMEESGDYTLEAHRLAFYGNNFQRRKGEEMRRHFELIIQSNAILVINNAKHGVQGYIGANVLMEMGVAFEHGLGIFVLNPLDEKSAFMDEIMAMQPVVLSGKLDLLLRSTL